MNIQATTMGHIFSNMPRFGYLDPKDRYLSKKTEPLLTFNVIGTGSNGQEHMVNTIFEGRGTIKGIYDPAASSAAAARAVFSSLVKDRELVVYDTLADVCSDPEVDGLIISTPNHTHLEVLRQAAPCGKHILLEKPMATTVEDAWEIVRIAEAYPATLQIGLQYRYKAIYAEAIQEAFHRRSIGDLKTISITEHRIPFLDKVNQWNKFNSLSGGTLVEKCCHYFDLLNLFSRSLPLQVFGSGNQACNFTDFTYDGKASDIIDNAMVIVDYENGVRGSFDLCMFSPLFHEEIVLCGEEGRLSARESQNYLDGNRVASSMQLASNKLEPCRTTCPKYPAPIEELGHHGATFFEHRNFVENILGRTTNTATVLEGFRSVVLGAAAQESIRLKRPVLIGDYLRDHGLDPSAMGRVF
jgi:myo-inositol 2-dehydrogenase / D-chiro-inositol 1-dehydrogenase